MFDSEWKLNSNAEKSVHKAAASLHLKKYGKFSEELWNRENSLRWGLGSSLEYLLEGPIRLMYSAEEQIGINSLVELENNVLSKVLASIGGTCREIRSLKLQSRGFEQRLFAQGERILENRTYAGIGSLQRDLQDLSIFLRRVFAVVGLTTKQLSSLAGGPHQVYLPVLLEAYLELFAMLLVLDELLDAHPGIAETWKKYRVDVRSVLHDRSRFEEDKRKRLQAFEKLLKDLQAQLLSKSILADGIESVMDLKKSSGMADHLLAYLRTLAGDVEARANQESMGNQYQQPLSKPWIRLNVGMVVVTRLFGNCDKKLLKRIVEFNRRLFAVTLVGNVVWVPNKFLSEFLSKETSSFNSNPVNVQVGEKILSAKTQKLAGSYADIIRRAVNWCCEMYGGPMSSEVVKVSEIDLKLPVLLQILSLLQQIREVVSSVTNLHAFLVKPMNRQTVRLICRLVELQKCLETTFHSLADRVVEAQVQTLQLLSYQILVSLEAARKNLVQRDKGYNRSKLDALSLVNLSMRLVSGPATLDRRTIVRCSLAWSMQLHDSFGKEEDILKLRGLLDTYDAIAELSELVKEACDYSVLAHHRNIVPVYLSMTHDSTFLDHLVYLFDAFPESKSMKQQQEQQNQQLHQQEQDEEEKLGKILVKTILEPTSREIETDLRLHVHSRLHLKLDVTNPLKGNGWKNPGDGVIQLPAVPVPGKSSPGLVSAKRYLEHYLDSTFYNLTSVALYDWRTYTTMHSLARYKYRLESVQNHLPTQTLEQGLDVLEVMRNIHVFVSRYLYNLNTQTFVEHQSTGKYLNTIGIKHIANSIRAHGTGIMSTTVNFIYQYLRIKLHTFSQFLFDEHIKSRLLKDLKHVRMQRDSPGSGKPPYGYERAEKFQKGIRKLGLTPDGLSYLDQFRQLITQIGNALGYVRLIRSAGLHASSNAVSFLPSISSSIGFRDLCQQLGFSRATETAAGRFDSDLEDLVRNFTEGIEYFRLLIDVFSPSFRDPTKAQHLQQFYAIVPPLTLSFVDNSVANKEKIFKKNQQGAAFTDDGFAMGVAYINALLDQSNQLDSLQWFETVERHLRTEIEALVNSRDDVGDEKLQQTRALTLKRLQERTKEFQLLFYSLSGARVFFQQPD